MDRKKLQIMKSVSKKKNSEKKINVNVKSFSTRIQKSKQKNNCWL